MTIPIICDTIIYDEDGTKLITYTYDAWGNCTVSYPNNGSSSTAIYNPFRYRGYYLDTETGFYYLNSRYYDPAIGRFITADKFSTIKATPFGLTDKNLYAYCDDNPVTRRDDGGAFWGTFFDVVSLVSSIVDVIQDPKDPLNWIGLAGDIIDLAPVVSGVGEISKAVSKGLGIADNVHDAKKVADNVGDAASVAKKGWSLGDDITTLTKAGKEPSLSTVRSRYWKNEALNNAASYTQSNLDRMAKGLAPQVSLNGKMYSMELHHITPRRFGGSNSYDNLLKVTPWKHAEIDPFRHFVP